MKINLHFSDSELYVSWTREGSFESTKENIVKELKILLGFEDFIIWNKSFTAAIEFNKIGVLRCRKVNL